MHQEEVREVQEGEKERLSIDPKKLYPSEIRDCYGRELRWQRLKILGEGLLYVMGVKTRW